MLLQQGVGFDEHLSHVFKGLALDISNSMETLGTDEVCEIPTRRSPLRLVARALANTRTHHADADALHRAHIQHSLLPTVATFGHYVRVQRAREGYRGTLQESVSGN
jgi:hypothetical protein